MDARAPLVVVLIAACGGEEPPRRAADAAPARQEQPLPFALDRDAPLPARAPAAHCPPRCAHADALALTAPFTSARCSRRIAAGVDVLGVELLGRCLDGGMLVVDCCTVRGLDDQDVLAALGWDDASSAGRLALVRTWIEELEGDRIVWEPRDPQMGPPTADLVVDDGRVVVQAWIDEGGDPRARRFESRRYHVVEGRVTVEHRVETERPR